MKAKEHITPTKTVAPGSDLPPNGANPAVPAPPPQAGPLAPPPASSFPAREGSLLSKLDPNQRLELFKWLEDRPISMVLGLVAAPPPAGFGIQTSESALRRVRAIVNSSVIVGRLTKAYDTCEYIATTVPAIEEIETVTLQVLQQKVFEAVKSDMPRPDLPELVTALERLNSIRNKRERLKLDQDRAAVQPPQRHQIAVQIMPAQQQEKVVSADSTLELPPATRALPPTP
jgi:hypothetical protein